MTPRRPIFSNTVALAYNAQGTVIAERLIGGVQNAMCVEIPRNCMDWM